MIGTLSEVLSCQVTWILSTITFPRLLALHAISSTCVANICPFLYGIDWFVTHPDQLYKTVTQYILFFVRILNVLNLIGQSSFWSAILNVCWRFEVYNICPAHICWQNWTDFLPRQLRVVFFIIDRRWQLEIQANLNFTSRRNIAANLFVTIVQL